MVKVFHAYINRHIFHSKKLFLISESQGPYFKKKQQDTSLTRRQIHIPILESWRISIKRANIKYCLNLRYHQEIEKKNY